jgi:NAD(P)H-hydrate epimerase
MKTGMLTRIFRSDQVRDIDAYTIKNEPIQSIDLMERAGHNLFTWITGTHSEETPFVIFSGTGNNGGDGLVVGRLLRSAGYPVRVFLVRYSNRISEDCKINFERIQTVAGIEVEVLKPPDPLPVIRSDEIILDALFGSGLKRPLEGPYARLVQHLNHTQNVRISIDMPSGLFGEDNSQNQTDHIIKAHVTLSLQFPKLSFMFPENQDFVGRFEILPIGLHPEIIATTPTPYYYLNPEFIGAHLIKRGRFSHKGHFGHVLLISGCYGKMGAAILASRACLRSGVGLLTTHVPRLGNAILQTAVPEAMISLDQSDILFSEAPDLAEFSHIGIGPALGCKSNSRKGLEDLIKRARSPMVIDADGINILGAHPEWISDLPENSILTPHPKEFQRLVQQSGNGYQRHLQQIAFSERNKLIVVLKGGHTSVSLPGGNCYFNSTGNPGMATAGSGDVLTGILLGLLGQGYEPAVAAFLGVYLHGLAGDLARKDMGEEALIASDIIDHMGPAFKMIGGGHYPSNF